MRTAGSWCALIVACLVAAGPAIGAEKLLLERRSPYNRILVSEDERGYRILRFEAGGALQSVVKPGDPDHLELAYVRAMPVAFVHVVEPRNVLVVGLGGGSIPSFVHKRFPRTKVDVVDIDPGVVAVARSHFGFVEDERMRAHVEDGRRFIERAVGRYDVIFLDGFGTDSVPRHLTTREFHQSVKRALTSEGVVVGNVWARESNRQYDSMVKTYRVVYDEVAVVEVEGTANRILVACPRRMALPPEEVVRRGRVLTQRLPLRTDLGEVLERGYRPIGRDGDAGQVLTDPPPPAEGGTGALPLAPVPQPAQ